MGNTKFEDIRTACLQSRCQALFVLSHDGVTNTINVFSEINFNFGGQTLNFSSLTINLRRSTLDLQNLILNLSGLSMHVCHFDSGSPEFEPEWRAGGPESRSFDHEYPTGDLESPESEPELAIYDHEYPSFGFERPLFVSGSREFELESQSFGHGCLLFDSECPWFALCMANAPKTSMSKMVTAADPKRHVANMIDEVSN
jgi:hypothetical protein